MSSGADAADVAESGERRVMRFLLRGHKASVLCLASDSESASRHSERRLASGSSDGTCRVWDLRARRSVRAASVGGEVSSVAFHPGDEHMLIAAAGPDLFSFDLRSDRVVLPEPDRRCVGLASEEINHVVVDGRSKLAAVAEDSGAVHLLDTNIWERRSTLGGRRHGHSNVCSSVALRPTGGWCLASGSLDATVILWQQSGKGRTIEMPPDADDAAATTSGGPQLLNPPFVHSLAFSPDGRTLAAGLGDSTIALLEVSGSGGAEHRQRLREGHAAAVAQVLYTPQGALISAGNDLALCLWGIPEGAAGPPSSRIAHSEKVNWLAWAEGTLLVAGVGNDIVAYTGLDR